MIFRDCQREGVADEHSSGLYLIFSLYPHSRKMLLQNGALPIKVLSLFCNSNSNYIFLI